MLTKKTVTFPSKRLKTNMLMIKNIVKLEIIIITQVNTEVLDIAYLC